MFQRLLLFASRIIDCFIGMKKNHPPTITRCEKKDKLTFAGGMMQTQNSEKYSEKQLKNLIWLHYNKLWKGFVLRLSDWKHFDLLCVYSLFRWILFLRFGVLPPRYFVRDMFDSDCQNYALFASTSTHGDSSGDQTEAVNEIWFYFFIIAKS